MSDLQTLSSWPDGDPEGQNPVVPQLAVGLGVGDGVGDEVGD